MLQVIAFEGASHAHRQHELVIMVDEHGDFPAADKKELPVVVAHEIMAEAVVRRRRFDAQIRRKRRDDIRMMRHFFADGRRLARQFQDERDADLLFAECRIVPQTAFFKELFAMVAGEDDDRVVAELRIVVQHGGDFREQRVQVVGRVAVAVVELLRVLFGDGRVVDLLHIILPDDGAFREGIGGVGGFEESEREERT